jgi:hypothetical protein
MRHVDAPAGELRWIYAIPADKGAKMLLLTVGRQCVPGNWTGALGHTFIAHCPMPQRDKAEERRLGLLP